MEDFDLNLVAKKSIQSIIALVSRTLFVQVLSIVASFILTVYLDPRSFGIFFLVSSIIVFLNYFQDIGLAASLIQKKEEPDISDYRNAFTIQQIMVLAVSIPLFILAPKVGEFFNFGRNGVFLFDAFLISFLLSSLRTIPTVMLERHLNFHKLVIPQIGENLVYNCALILFAVSGFGLASFIIAVLARSVTGLVLTYIIQPWKIGFSLDFKRSRSLLSFGLPFQANSILALIKDDLINIYVGKVLPLTQVGYIGFGQKWAFMPLRLVLDNVIKIIFPSLSRLQNDKEALKIVIEKSIFMIAVFIFPIAAGFITLSSLFIDFIPRYAKWEPAIISLMFFSLNTVFGSVTNPLTNLLNAIGKVKITLYFMIFWTVLTWTLTPLFIVLFGYNGVSLASFMVAVSSLIILYKTREFVKFSFIYAVSKPLVAAFFMAFFIFVTRRAVTSLTFLFFEIIAAGIFYFITLTFLARKEMFSAVKLVRENIRTQK